MTGVEKSLDFQGLPKDRPYPAARACSTKHSAAKAVFGEFFPHPPLARPWVEPGLFGLEPAHRPKNGLSASVGFHAAAGRAFASPAQRHITKPKENTRWPAAGRLLPPNGAVDGRPTASPDSVIDRSLCLGIDQKSMQRPAFSQSPNRVGSGPSRPPISLTAAFLFVALSQSTAGATAASPAGTDSGAGLMAAPLASLDLDLFMISIP
jgi:hypothetical protein